MIPRGRQAGVWTFAALAAMFQPSPAVAIQPPAPAARESHAPVRVQQTPAPETPEPGEWGFRWEDHPSLRLGKDSRIDFRLRLQGDIEDSAVPSPGETDSALDIARKRIGFEGTIGGVVEFQVERELDSPDAWRDVFVNYRQFQFVRVQYGQFKLPFSLEMNRGATRLDFVHRSRAATTLAPGRDRGIMVHGRLLHRRFRYEAGSFEHDGSNARSRSGERVAGGRTLAVRLSAEPFRRTKSPASDLVVAIAGTSSRLTGEGFPSLRGRTVLDQRIYTAEYLVNGRRNRLGAEARWRSGPFSIASEYIRVTDERLGESVEETDLSPLLATGWYVSGTWTITGEDKARDDDAPRRPIFRGGVGAVELAARVERIRFDSRSTLDDLPSTSVRADRIVGNGDRAETLGVNWYLNRWIKLQLNVIRETIDNPGQGPLPSQPTFWSRVFRFQFTL